MISSSLATCTVSSINEHNCSYVTWLYTPVHLTRFWNGHQWYNWYNKNILRISIYVCIRILEKTLILQNFEHKYWLMAASIVSPSLHYFSYGTLSKITIAQSSSFPPPSHSKENIIFIFISWHRQALAYYETLLNQSCGQERKSNTTSSSAENTEWTTVLD